MARDGSGAYSLPANTLAVSGDPISSTKFNSLVQDLESDANVDRPIAAGGTGASTAQAALTNLFSGASPGGADKIAFWDQSAAAFGWLSLGTGLTFNGTSLDLDADLSTLAGLTVAANNFIVGNSGGTAWEVKTPSQARTSLGLVIGTDVQAYDAGLQSIAGLTTAADTMIYTTALDTYATTSLTSFARTILDDANQGAVQTTIGYTAADVLTKLLTVDGAGSNLDADTLDGVQGSSYATLTGAQTFSGVKTFNVGSSASSQVVLGGINNQAAFLDIQANAGQQRLIRFLSAGQRRWQVYVNLDTESGSNAGSSFLITAYDDANAAIGNALTIDRPTLAATFGGTLSCGTSNAFTCGTIELGNASDTTLSRVSAGVVAIEGVNIVTVSATQTLTNKTLTSPTINGAALSGTLSGTPTFSGAVVLSGSPTLTTPTINGGTIQSRVQASSETTGTLTSASANKTIQATGDITINNSVFSAGDLVLYYAGASARSITAGTISTMRLAGTATTGTRSVAARGVAMLFFVSATEVVIGGPGVT